jgi:hypothetical protein
MLSAPCAIQDALCGPASGWPIINVGYIISMWVYEEEEGGGGSWSHAVMWRRIGYGRHVLPYVGAPEAVCCGNLWKCCSPPVTVVAVLQCKARHIKPGGCCNAAQACMIIMSCVVCGTCATNKDACRKQGCRCSGNITLRICGWHGTLSTQLQ